MIRSRSLALVLAFSPLGFASQVAPESASVVDLFVEVQDAVATVPANNEKARRERLGALRLDVLEQSAARRGGFGRLALPLFDGEVLVTRIDHVERAANDGWVWSGTVEGSVEGSVLLSVVGDAVSGSIRTEDKLYAVRYAGAGLHAIAEIDEDRFEPCANGSSEAAGVHTHKARDVAQPSGSSTSSAAAVANNPPTIDVVVVYTPQARTAQGGTNAINALINLAISETNDAYVKSQVNQELRLQATQEMTGYTESGSFSTELNRLTSKTDAYLNEAHTLRSTWGADAVAMIVAGSQYCGIAHLMSFPSNSFKTQAFSVTARTCATGYYSFGHELGHNFGSTHDRANAGGGAFQYSFGYRTPNNQYRTIMAYSPGSRIRRFSNPNITYAGFVMGIAAPSSNSAENWKSLNNSSPYTSQWKCAVTVMYGTGKATSSGLVPTLGSSGSRRISKDELKLELTHAEPNKSAIAFYGFTQADIAWNGGSLYVSGSKKRLGVQSTDGTGAATWDFPLATGFTPGDQLFAQVWFRDPTHPDGSTVGLSNGLRIDVCE